MRTLFSALVVSFASGLFAAPLEAREDLGELLQPLREEFDLPALAAAVSRDGEIIAAGAVGTRVQGQDIPVRVEDRFHIGSDTKAMTATIAGHLVDQGLLRWDSSVGEILGDAVPGLHPELASVTLTQLLSHTSGIPSDNEQIIELYYSPESVELNPTETRLWMVEQVKDWAPAFPEDESPFQYSNLGYLFAGAMLEAASGQPWERLIHEVIFEPLALESAGLGPQASMGRYDAPVGHRLNPDGTLTPMAWGASADVPALLGPAGMAHMSVLDFARWGGWNAQEEQPEPPIVTGETLAFLHRSQVQTPPLTNPRPGTPERGEYALGWQLAAPAWADGDKLMHNGSNSMNLAKIFVDRDRHLAITVVTNRPGKEADEAAGRVLESLFGRYADD